MILAADDPGRIVAVLDWELATIGDPLSDLARMLATWTQADDPPRRLEILGKNFQMASVPGFWSRHQVAEEYARLTGWDLSDLNYHMALAFYKLAVICQGIHARYMAGVTRGEGFEEYEQRVRPLAELALAALEDG